MLEWILVEKGVHTRCACDIGTRSLMLKGVFAHVHKNASTCAPGLWCSRVFLHMLIQMHPHVLTRIHQAHTTAIRKLRRALHMLHPHVHSLLQAYYVWIHKKKKNLLTRQLKVHMIATLSSATHESKLEVCTGIHSLTLQCCNSCERKHTRIHSLGNLECTWLLLHTTCVRMQLFNSPK